jgi:hypothetical protein
MQHGSYVLRLEGIDSSRGRISRQTSVVECDHGSDARDHQTKGIWLMADVGSRNVSSRLYVFSLRPS